MYIKAILAVFLLSSGLIAQETKDSDVAKLDKILERLTQLEQENTELTREVHSLREELLSSRSQDSSISPAASSEPSLGERVSVAEKRIEEQSQTKVEAGQKLPVALTGMLLFNAFSATGDSEGATYGLLAGPNSSGATLRQTIIGFDFQGPSLPGAGKVRGNLTMDFYPTGANPNAAWLRIRRGVISLNWANRTFTVGQDKPLIAPHEPNSFAEVGVPPLAGAGNLWFWLPQARYEERVHIGSTNGLTAQVAALQTNESSARLSNNYSYSLEPSRPALEGRLAFWHNLSNNKRLEIAPGFDVSTTHVAGTSVSSHLASLDWLVMPWSKLEVSGTVFQGQNLAGIGGLPQGFTIRSYGNVVPVHSGGGWLQLTYPLTSRLTLNMFGGLQSNRSRDLMPGDIARNLMYASNLVYHLESNVIVSVEALQLRTTLFPNSTEIRNRYDLALGYLF